MKRLRPQSLQAREEIRKAIAYLQINQDCMRYAEFRRQGLFVGSGVVEAGCKTIMGLRLKQSGMRWTVTGAHAAAQVQLIEPDLPRGRTLIKKEHDSLNARPQKRTARAIEHGMQITTLQQQFAQAHGRIISIRQKRILNNHARASARSHDLDEVLQEQIRRLAGADRKILLDLFALLAAEGWIGEHHVIAVLLLNVGEVFGERVGVDDVGRLDTVQDHVHDPDHVSQRLLLLADEGAGLQS